MIEMTKSRWLIAAIATLTIPVGLALRRVAVVLLELARYAGYIAITTFAALYVVELILILVRAHA